MTTPTETAIAAVLNSSTGKICRHFRVKETGLHGLWVHSELVAMEEALRAPVAGDATKGRSRDAIDWKSELEYLQDIGVVDKPPPAAGGMKAAEEWVPEIVNTYQRDLSELVRRIQADALATQPEARPLRELIAEGHEQFWIYRFNEWRFCRFGMWKMVNDAHPSRQLIQVQPDMHVGIIGLDILEAYGWNDCPAIPILKPTGTPSKIDPIFQCDDTPTAKG